MIELLKIKGKPFIIFDNFTLEKEAKFISDFRSIVEKVIYFKPHF